MHTTGLSELIIKVDNIERMSRFYREVVGLEPDESAPGETPWFWSGEPGRSARFAISKGRASLADVLPFDEHAPIPDVERWKKAHFAFRVPAGSLEVAIQRLEDHAIPVFGPITLDWMRARACYFWDTEGHLVEFWSPLEDGPETR
jgi:catechol-2,3-dioxygenase